MSRIYLILLLIGLLFTSSSVFAQSKFFQERNRGWLWFEEKPKIQKPKKPAANAKLTKEQMQEMKAKNEQFSEELELLRHAMIRHPENLEYIKRYKEKEKIMLDKSMVLSHNFAMVNFLNPDIPNALENPQNIYGRKALKENEQQDKEQKLTSLSSKIELFLFFKSDCNHCELLEKHLARFASKYGFKVEAVSIDRTVSKFFKTYNDQQSKDLVKRLQLGVMPTVIAVTTDSKQRFELARGAVSVPDLEDAGLLLAEYLKNYK